MIAKHPTCKPHPYQDKRYGYLMRVCNPLKDFASNGKVSCTVCGEVFNIHGEPQKKKPQK